MHARALVVTHGCVLTSTEGLSVLGIRKGKNARFDKLRVIDSDAVVDRVRHGESLKDLDEPAGAVDEVDDDGDVVVISKIDRVRHLVRNNIPGDNRARIFTGAVEMIRKTPVLGCKQRRSVALHVGRRRVEEARLRGLFRQPRSPTRDWRRRRPPSLDGGADFDDRMFATLAASVTS